MTDYRPSNHTVGDLIDASRRILNATTPNKALAEMRTVLYDLIADILDITSDQIKGWSYLEWGAWGLTPDADTDAASLRIQQQFVDSLMRSANYALQTHESPRAFITPDRRLTSLLYLDVNLATPIEYLLDRYTKDDR